MEALPSKHLEDDKIEKQPNEYESKEEVEDKTKSETGLLHLSDDVLLYILKFCPARDLKALGFSCQRLSALIQDHTLWHNVDARSGPSGFQRLRWLLDNTLNEGTKSISIHGYAKEVTGCRLHKINREEAIKNGLAYEGKVSENQERRRRCPWGDPLLGLQGEDTGPIGECTGPQFTFNASIMRRLIEVCPNLQSLSLEYCNINYKEVKITNFPKTLTHLSLRGTKCFYVPHNASFLQGVHDAMPLLESLDLSECEWLEPAALLPLSKAPQLRRLLLRDCDRMTEFVAYASLAMRYGFRKLEVLDLRGTPISDAEVSSLGWLPALQELYLAPSSREKSIELLHTHYRDDPIVAHVELDSWENEELECFVKSAEEEVAESAEEPNADSNPSDDDGSYSGVIVIESMLSTPQRSHQRIQLHCKLVPSEENDSNQAGPSGANQPQPSTSGNAPKAPKRKSPNKEEEEENNKTSKSARSDDKVEQSDSNSTEKSVSSNEQSSSEAKSSESTGEIAASTSKRLRSASNQSAGKDDRGTSKPKSNPDDRSKSKGSKDDQDDDQPRRKSARICMKKEAAKLKTEDAAASVKDAESNATKSKSPKDDDNNDAKPKSPKDESENQPEPQSSGSRSNPPEPPNPRGNPPEGGRDMPRPPDDQFKIIRARIRGYRRKDFVSEEFRRFIAENNEHIWRGDPQNQGQGGRTVRPNDHSVIYFSTTEPNVGNLDEITMRLGAALGATISDPHISLRNVFVRPPNQNPADESTLVTDMSILRFGNSRGGDLTFFSLGERVNMYNATRPNRSNLRILSVTGYPQVTDASLTHLTVAAPDLRLLDLRGTGVTENGVNTFRSLRPDCEVVVTPKEGDKDGKSG